MKAQRIDSDTLLDHATDTSDTPTKSNLATKLERRRRIEDLDEEKRLREELDEF